MLDHDISAYLLSSLLTWGGEYEQIFKISLAEDDISNGFMMPDHYDPACIYEYWLI